MRTAMLALIMMTITLSAQAASEVAERTCRMLNERAAFSPPQCTAVIDRQIAELAQASGLRRDCAGLHVYQVYHYVLSGESEEMAKIMAYEDTKKVCK